MSGFIIENYNNKTNINFKNHSNILYIFIIPLILIATLVILYCGIFCLKEIFRYVCEIKPTIRIYPQINNQISYSKKSINIDSLEECSICIDSFLKNDIIISLNCNHVFHYKCINEWKKNSNSCPLCRNKLI